jgi:hypothetical protein
MFKAGSKVYKLIPAVEIIDNVFKAGHVIELHVDSILHTQYFTADNKSKIIEDLKKLNGFKTEAQTMISKLLADVEEEV